ncbi:small RNA 2'-O-methyltransferase [Hyla sarda]|uniref:small RNA 2'-O-methyltransferase n=1 Tax=Hyla sarda TaxID=327740 RepID=UPI0024C2A3AF|nr:small RNA 2'-O-methyltransferase [Hyla sarda]XP_056379492.1 small RNA 2'-O-methyltransferase [Hyla sarda]
MEPIRFKPPLYEQRYEFVKSYIDTHKPKKVADLGCSECSLLHKLKFRSCIQELVGVDIDEDILKRKGYTLTPLPVHYLDPLERPLTVTLYHGSVCEKDPALLGLDLITCIELIEHLVTEDLEKFQDALFGFMAPDAVLISTPNVEFNVLLSDNSRFRHPDHKFEWNRKEFQTWAMNMSRTYNYTVEFTGVGEAGPESQDVGYCSQIGIFTKNYMETEESISNKKKYKGVYRSVLHVVYPSIQDERYLRKVVLTAALSHAECIKANFLRNLFPEEDGDQTNMADNKDKPPVLSKWLPSLQTATESNTRPPFLEGDAIHVPIETLFAIPRVKELCGSLDVLRNMMNGEITLSADGSAIVYPLHVENDLDSDMSNG